MPKPKNSPKTGGRKTGTPNKATHAIRDQIKAADPIGFLVEAVRFGRVPNIGDDGLPDGTYEAVTSLPRINAAVRLANKIVPDAKERAVRFHVEAIDSPESALKAIACVVEAMSAGELTAGEANAVCGVIGIYIKAFETNEILGRIEALEDI